MNTRPFKLTMARARREQMGEHMRPGVMLGSEALDPHVVHGADAACDDCGHVRCSCVRIRIEVPPPAELPAYDAWKRTVNEALGKPAPTDERDVRVGDVWRLNHKESPAVEYRVIELCDDPRDGPLCERIDDCRYRHRTSLCERSWIGDLWSLVSRAEPAQVDDGEPRVGDEYGGVFEGRLFRVARIADGSAFDDRSAMMHVKSLRDLRDSRGKPLTRVTRGPAP